MPSSLLDNLNSDYIEALGDLLSNRKPEPVLVYVESHEDISFWYGILKDYESSKVKFDIQLPSKDSLAKGKTKALERNNDLLRMGVGKRFIICIDSDYDYLLQNKTEQSKLINQNDFIFQTYAYSIENLRCFSSSLYQISVQITNTTHGIIDFEELLKSYSKMTYPLLLWSIFLKNSSDSDSMTLTQFCNLIKLGGNVNIHEKGKTHLESLGNRITHQINILQFKFPNYTSEIQSLQEELIELGLNSENAYLFIQGHTIHDNFVLPFLNSLSNIIRSQTESRIMSQAIHQNQKENELNHYRNSLTESEKALKTNTEFKSCFLYHKIKADLDRYILTLDLE